MRVSFDEIVFYVVKLLIHTVAHRQDCYLSNLEPNLLKVLRWCYSCLRTVTDSGLPLQIV